METLYIGEWQTCHSRAACRLSCRRRADEAAEVTLWRNKYETLARLYSQLRTEHF